MATGIGVVDFHRNVDLNAAKGINDVLEAIEIDRCIMGNRHTGKRRYRAHDKRSTTKRGGSVELIRPVAFDVHIRVALDRDKRHRFLPRIDTRKNHRITSEGISVSPRFPTLFRRVGAHDEAIKRIAWLNRFGRKRSFQLVVDIVLKLVVQGIHVHDARKRHAASRKNSEHNNRPLSPLLGNRIGITRIAVISNLVLTASRKVVTHFADAIFVFVFIIHGAIIS